MANALKRRGLPKQMLTQLVATREAQNNRPLPQEMIRKPLELISDFSSK
jgi:hypothetical protein